MDLQRSMIWGLYNQIYSGTGKNSIPWTTFKMVHITLLKRLVGYERYLVFNYLHVGYKTRFISPRWNVYWLTFKMGFMGEPVELRRNLIGNVTSSTQHPPYWTSELLTFRPTAISDLSQLFIFVLFEGLVRLRQFLGWALRLGQARGPSDAARTGYGLALQPKVHLAAVKPRDNSCRMYSIADLS